MRTLQHVERSFNAAHQVLNDGTGLCGPHRHGHRWTVSFLAEANPDSYGGYVVTPAFAELVAELDRRDLNELVRSTYPTAGGLAGWFLERLRLHVSGLRSVTVAMDGYAVTMEV